MVNNSCRQDELRNSSSRVGQSVTGLRCSEDTRLEKRMIRHCPKASESWNKLPWKKFRKDLFRLQRRVYKAVQAGDMRKAKSLQKLILKSTSSRYLAIRQVTQLNAGKKTPGIDGKASLSFSERFELNDLLKSSAQKWKHRGLRQIPIPKKDGSLRILKVPTMADRAWQCHAKNAIEPAHEANFNARSYGFRPGRSTQDAQKMIFNNLRSKSKGMEKRILELDIEKCFDRINHSIILSKLIAPNSIKIGILRCLKAGVNPEYPDQGTCQGGVISPLLANVALNGIEEIHPSVRYADDMVFFLKPENDAKKLTEEISNFLAQRGLNISQKKTKLTAATDGFNFLGWHFKVQGNGKFHSNPSEENYNAFRRKVKTIVNSSNYGAVEKATKLGPIVRGWRNYHRYCQMKGGRHSLFHIQKRTVKVFNKEPRINRMVCKKLIDRAFPKVPVSENKYVNVKGEKSPFDGDIVYWSLRNSKLYDGPTSTVLRRQAHACGSCKLKMQGDELIQLHHIDGNHHNWKWDNLVALHQSCHQYLHMRKS